MTQVDDQSGRARARFRLALWGALLVLLMMVSLLWSFTPVRQVFDLDALAAGVHAIRAHPAAPWLVLAGFVVGGLVVLPVTLMNVFTVVVFGPLAGVGYALGGATLSALTSFGLGRLLGHRALAQLTGSRIHALSLRLRAGGITAVAALRLIPVAHFTVISLAAGASHVRTRDYVLGTLLGMAPGIAVIAVMVDRLSAVSERPEPVQWFLLAAVSLAMLALLLGLRFAAGRLRRRVHRGDGSEHQESAP
jgi:uncharacterized membrane protein YdjX (TVP38/TMEM64 family)